MLRAATKAFSSPLPTSWDSSVRLNLAVATVLQECQSSCAMPHPTLRSKGSEVWGPASISEQHGPVWWHAPPARRHPHIKPEVTKLLPVGMGISGYSLNGTRPLPQKLGQEFHSLAAVSFKSAVLSKHAPSFLGHSHMQWQSV